MKNLASLINKILKNSSDPLRIRKTTAPVFNNLKLIEVNEEKIKKVASLVREKIDKKQLLTEEQFGSAEPTPQLIFVLDAINFCFWAKKGEEKWTVEYPQGNFISNGWFALTASIERARKEKVPILEAKYLKNLKLSEAEHVFRSTNDTPIPLLPKRVKILNQVGEILLKKYKGNIYNLLTTTDLDVGKIASAVVKNFPCYSDTSKYNDKKICFYKRAQIFAYDISLLLSLKTRNLNSLTVFSDYKVPQILRAFSVLEYKPELADKIDNYIELESGSFEETEIRAATIWAGELIAHKAKVPPVLVDNALWKMSQSLVDVKPYHRTRATSY